MLSEETLYLYYIRRHEWGVLTTLCVYFIMLVIVNFNRVGSLFCPKRESRFRL